MIGTYSDENIQITLVQSRAYDSTVYWADVQVTSAEYLKTAFAQDTYGKNVTEKTSAIAEAHNAILAINGDFYGAQETGYVIRNGIVYRDTAKRNTDVLCLWADGTMSVTDGSNNSAQSLVDSGVWQAFSFGPALLESGEIIVTEYQEVGKAMASNPRTAIGLIAPHIVRRLVGGDSRKVIPLSAILGASCLLLADLAARLLLPVLGTTPPVGALTALAGAPFFLRVLKTDGGKFKS